jgi:hypothetical protein
MVEFVSTPRWDDAGIQEDPVTVDTKTSKRDIMKAQGGDTSEIFGNY